MSRRGISNLGVVSKRNFESSEGFTPYISFASPDNRRSTSALPQQRFHDTNSVKDNALRGQPVGFEKVPVEYASPIDINETGEVL
jgi:hypothetical protein